MAEHNPSSQLDRLSKMESEYESSRAGFKHDLAERERRNSELTIQIKDLSQGNLIINQLRIDLRASEDQLARVGEQLSKLQTEINELNGKLSQ